MGSAVKKSGHRLDGFFPSLALIVISTLLTLLLGEVVIRLKNSSMRNYDIEMWRYALELKQRSDIALLGHEHIPSKNAVLQSVNIRINEHGLRGGPLLPASEGHRRILFLGSSITLGWGVPESETITERLKVKFKSAGQDVEVLNGGIGNYNAVRYVERFNRRLVQLNPTDIVVHYFVRDAEVLEAGGGNILLRHSQLAVTFWSALNRLLVKGSEKTIADHYREIYSPDAPGFVATRVALKALAEYARRNEIRLYLAMTPDVHDLVDYKLGFIHDQVKTIALDEGYGFVDLLPIMKDFTPQQLWAMPGDPHPNGFGHKLMAEALFPLLQLPVEK